MKCFRDALTIFAFLDNFRSIKEEYFAESIEHLVDFSTIKRSFVVDFIESKIGKISCFC